MPLSSTNNDKELNINLQIAFDDNYNRNVIHKMIGKKMEIPLFKVPTIKVHTLK